MSFTVLGDSNVDRFWLDAMTDRKELKDKVSFTKVVNLGQFDSTLSSVVSGNVILSLLTNPVVDHVESISPASQENLEKSISTIINKLLEESIYPLCFRIKDSKVSYTLAFIYGAYCWLLVYFIFK